MTADNSTIYCTPYYQDGLVTIYHGDARDVLPSLEASGIDLLLTDPPYGMSYESNWRQDAYGPIAGDGDDCQRVVTDVLNLACGVLRRGRHAYIFGRPDLSSVPLTPAVELIWDKGRMGMGDLSLPWGAQHEPIQFAVYFPSRGDRTSKGRLAARLRRGSVITCPRLDGNSSTHPTEKPVLLLRQLIESSSAIGETVLDPFMGVGSTLLAARMEGREAIGIEVEERYCEIAAKRLSASERSDEDGWPCVNCEGLHDQIDAMGRDLRDAEAELRYR